MSVFRRFFRRRQREAGDGPETTKQAGAAEEFMQEVSPSELMSTLLTVRGPEFVQALGEAIAKPQLELHVRSISGATIPVHATEGMSIGDVKRICERACGTPRHMLALTLQEGPGRELPDDVTLGAEGVTSGDVLTLVVRASFAPQEVVDRLDELAADPGETLTFGWDAHGAGAVSELEFSGDRRETARKTGAPDCSLCRGAQPLEAGLWFFEVHVRQKGDETWVGVTADASLVDLRNKTTDTMSAPRVVSYYDGSRGYRTPCLKSGPDGRRGEASPYGSGDSIGVLVHCDAPRSIHFFKNGVLQGEPFVGADVPAGPLWPIAHLDSANDVYVLRRMQLLRNGALLPQGTVGV